MLCRRLPPDHHASALGHRVVHMALHLLQRGFLDQRALVHAVLKAVAHLGRFDLGGELLDEFVVHAFLHIKRLEHTQVWPALRYLLAKAPSTALSMSASSNTMKGALPPSSSDIFLTVGATAPSGCGPPRCCR
jgi:hypothetical protein